MDASPKAPVIFVVDSSEADSDLIASALGRRFGADYEVICARAAGDGIEMLKRLSEDRRQVALLSADLHLPGSGGVDFIDRAHRIYPGASRVLLVPMDRHHTRVPFTQLTTLRRAMAMGQIDFWLLKGWATPEEWLYPQVQDALTAWTMVNRVRHLVYRVVGEQWDPRSHEVRDMLTRNGVPFEFYPLDSEEGRQLVDDLRIDVRGLPAFIRHDGTVLQNPTFDEIAEAHGIRTRPSSGEFDLVIVGAGPAGLGAAVYGASEGLRTLVLERQAIGGQAGTSSMIRNYLGFPRGIRGDLLAHHGWEQALFFGAEFVFTELDVQLSTRGDDRLLTFADGSEIIASAVIIATGVTYRRLGIPALERLVGAGVFYGAAGSEAPAMSGHDVYVVGGANSAGQAAINLARFASRVVLLVRGNSVSESMSAYLVTQLQATPNVQVRLNTRVIDGHGQDRLESLTLEDLRTGRREEAPAAAVFALIGAEPHTEWLRNLLCLRDGYIVTARDIPTEAWREARALLPFETSLPGVFAAGDVRYGSTKRVAGAAGEGAVTVGSVHRYLAERRGASA
jgi:thioredoxin reductase (NADPH)